MAEAALHYDIARDIGQQVESMIITARHQSETKVGKEIQRVRVMMEKMSEKIKMVAERLAAVESSNNGLLKADLQESVAKLEEVWESEVGTLKHELWQTIQAHNHNADLLKHHKDALDQVQKRMAETASDPGLEQVRAQLALIDKVMQREQVKEQQIDQFMQRFHQLQQQTSLIGMGDVSALGFPGMATAVAAQAQAAAATAAAMAAAGQKFPRKDDAAAKRAPKASAKKASTKAMVSSLQAHAASLRAEAPEFVPTFSAEAS